MYLRFKLPRCLFTATLNSTLIWTFCRLYDTYRVQLKFVSLQASLCKTRFMRFLSSFPFISNFSVCAAAGRIMTREEGWEGERGRCSSCSWKRPFFVAHGARSCDESHDSENSGGGERERGSERRREQKRSSGLGRPRRRIECAFIWRARTWTYNT